MDRSRSGCLQGLAGRFCRKCKSAEGGVSSWDDSPGAGEGTCLGDSPPACLYHLPRHTVHGEAWGSGSRYKIPEQDKNLVLILPVGVGGARYFYLFINVSILFFFHSSIRLPPCKPLGLE